MRQGVGTFASLSKVRRCIATGILEGASGRRGIAIMMGIAISILLTAQNMQIPDRWNVTPAYRTKTTQVAGLLAGKPRGKE
jgi:hypothetical protein